MPSRNLTQKFRRCSLHSAAMILLLAAGTGSAQLNDLRLPISLDADSTDYDGKSSMLVFRGMRLTQGNIGVQADEGLASKLDFEDSVWQFSGNVVIDTDNGRIECDKADLRFVGHRLEDATISGKPATFELQRRGSEQTTRAQAERLDYDFSAGVIEFAGDAVITEGGNQISSSYLVYNIKEQRINAQANGDGDERVKITYTPRAEDVPTGAARDSADDEAGDPEDPTSDDAPAGPRSMSILSVEEISKRYKFRDVVKGISVEIKSGEVVGLLGPNGAGKTTAFYMIVGLVAADKGRILLDGKDVTALPMHRRARLGVGYLPQEASIFRKLSVEQNVLAILENRKDLDRAGRERELDQLLDELHVGHVRTSLGISLSGGERRRVEIARALAANPRFVLLDEPFAGVDPISVLDIQRIIKHLCERDIGVLITDHNVRETLGICGRAYILSEGNLIASGTPDEILENQHVREVYLGQDFRL